MRPILSVISAAADTSLLTLAEIRAATGVPSGQDAALEALERRVAAAITSRCNVVAGGARAPTLRLETLSCQYRLDCPVERLLLRRRPVTGIASIVECGVTLTAADYEVDASTGSVSRLCGDYPAWWMPGKIVVEFDAGWGIVPENLRSAAMKLAAVMWSEAARVDPGLKRENIPGLIDREWWVGPSDDPLMSREIEELLADYINPAW